MNKTKAKTFKTTKSRYSPDGAKRHAEDHGLNYCDRCDLVPEGQCQEGCYSKECNGDISTMGNGITYNFVLARTRVLYGHCSNDPDYSYTGNNCEDLGYGMFPPDNSGPFYYYSDLEKRYDDGGDYERFIEFSEDGVMTYNKDKFSAEPCMSE